MAPEHHRNGGQHYTSAGGPFFSPDSQWIGFFMGNEMKKVAVAGGSITTICRGLDAPVRAGWGEDQRIVFSSQIPASPAVGLVSGKSSGQGGCSIVGPL